MSEDLLKSIDKKLTVMSRLLALNAVKHKPLNEQIELLSNAGMGVAEIASMLGRTPNNVRVQLHRKKKSKEKADEDE